MFLYLSKYEAVGFKNIQIATNNFDKGVRDQIDYQHLPGVVLCGKFQMRFAVSDVELFNNLMWPYKLSSCFNSTCLFKEDSMEYQVTQ